VNPDHYSSYSPILSAWTSRRLLPPPVSTLSPTSCRRRPWVFVAFISSSISLYRSISLQATCTSIRPATIHEAIASPHPRKTQQVHHASKEKNETSTAAPGVERNTTYHRAWSQTPLTKHSSTFTRSLSGESTSCNYIINTDLHKRCSCNQLKRASGKSRTLGSKSGMSGCRSGMLGSRYRKQIYGFGSGVTRAEKRLYGFGWQPRPKINPFGLIPISLGSKTGAEYQKQPGPKALTTLVLVF